MGKVKVGVVGCGCVSQRTYMPTLAQLAATRVDLVAVCDTVKKRAEEVREKFHAKECYDDFEKMLAKASIDMVVNLTDIFHHVPIIRAALRAGKHVYTEKPLAPTVEEANSLIEEAEKNKVKLACAPPLLLHPAIRQGKEIILSGTIGKICFARGHGSHAGIDVIEGWPTDASWFIKKGAGPAFDLGVYPLTVLTGIIGPAKRVTAFSGIAIPERLIKGGVTKGMIQKTEADDNTLLLLDFGDSTFAAVDATFCVKAIKGAAYEFYGSEGTLVFNRSTGSDFWFEAYSSKEGLPTSGWFTSRAKPFPSWRVPLHQTRPFWETSESWNISAGLVHLVDCILEDQKPLISGEHARHIVEIITKAYQSAETGRTQELVTTF